MRILPSIAVLLSFMLSLAACGGGGGGTSGSTGSGSSGSTENLNYNWPAHIVGYSIIFTVEGDSTSSPTGIPINSRVVYDYNASGSVKGTNPVSGNVYYPDSYTYNANKNIATINLTYSGGAATEKYVLTTTSATTGTFYYTGNVGDSRGDMNNWGSYKIQGTGTGNLIYPSYSLTGDGVNPIGGQVSGLSSPVTLQTNDGTTVTVEADTTINPDGSFSFPSVTSNGTTYDFSILSQPAGQTCTVTSSSSINTLQITCNANTVGGSISGLSGSLVLKNQAGVEFTVNAGTSYSFGSSFNWGEAYSVSIVSQPFAQACTLSNASGIFSSNVTNMNISCVDDLTGPSVRLLFDAKQLKFGWSAISGATHYQILENADGQSGFTQVGSDFTYEQLQYSGTYLQYKHEISVHLLDWDNAKYIIAACNGSRCLNSSEITLQSAYSQYAVGLFYLPSGYWGGDSGGMATSADGNTVAIGAPYEDSSTSGINSTPDAASTDSGAVYILVKTASGWEQQAYIKASNAGAWDKFGGKIALSADGNTLAVGATSEASIATGINGDQSDNSNPSTGAAYIFTRTGTTWTQQAYIKASNTSNGFGSSIALNSDGNTLVVGASSEASNATGINGNQNDTSSIGSGAAYVFTRTGTSWSQQAYIKASNTEPTLLNDCGGCENRTENFGFAVSLSADGNTLAVSAREENSSATGINGNQDDNLAPKSGAVYLFTRISATWSQQAYIKASNAEAYDRFGQTVVLSSDGSTLIVGATGEDSYAIGINGNQSENDDLKSSIGATYVFTRTNATWSQQAYIKPGAISHPQADYIYGSSICLSADGNLLVVSGAPSSTPWVYTRDGVTWSVKSHVTSAPNDNDPRIKFLGAFALNANGDSLFAYIRDTNYSTDINYMAFY